MIISFHLSLNPHFFDLWLELKNTYSTFGLCNKGKLQYNNGLAFRPQFFSESVNVAEEDKLQNKNEVKALAIKSNSEESFILNLFGQKLRQTGTMIKKHPTHKSCLETGP